MDKATYLREIKLIDNFLKRNNISKYTVNPITKPAHNVSSNFYRIGLKNDQTIILSVVGLTVFESTERYYTLRPRVNVTIKGL